MVRVFLWVIGSIGVIIVAMIVLFIFEMTPNSRMETKAEDLGEAYILKHFDGRAEVYDVLYDNMGNFEFEYAAKATHKTTGVNFLIYEAADSQSVKDTYAESYFEHQIEKDLRPFIDGIQGVVTHMVHISNVPLKYQREVDLPEYKDVSLDFNVIIDLDRGALGDDRETMEELFVYMKENLQMEHGAGRFVYEPSSGDEMLQMSY